MTDSFGLKIGLEGEKEFKKALAVCSRQQQGLSSCNLVGEKRRRYQ